MAKKFRGAEIVGEIDEALDKGLARFVIGTQSKLAAASPVDSGRLASSWYVGKGVPNRDERSKDWAEPGAKRVEIEKPLMKITMDSDWWISNNLPYAERAAFDPYNGRRGAGAWFTSIENRLAEDANRAFDYFLRKVK
jgi:hypothetical protein